MTQHLLADRRLVARTARRTSVLPEQADHGDVADVLVGERLALGQLLPVADAEQAGRGAVDVDRHPVLVAVDDLPARVDDRREAVDGRALVADRLGVLGRERLDRAAAEADAVARRRPGLDEQACSPPCSRAPAVIAVADPLPISAIAISEATPMMMPSVVSTDRSTFRRSDRRAVWVVRA